MSDNSKYTLTHCIGSKLNSFLVHLKLNIKHNLEVQISYNELKIDINKTKKIVKEQKQLILFQVEKDNTPVLMYIVDYDHKILLYYLTLSPIGQLIISILTSINKIIIIE